MPKRSDPVEALAKVLHRANERRYSEIGGFEPYEWDDESDDGRNRFRAMARAAIAHLKPRPTKRGAKRGK